MPAASFLTRCLAVLALAASACAQTAQPLQFGTAWYPEQWPESRWDADLTLMEQAHMNVVRVAEFAWSSIEPSEGHFELEWLDHAIALAAKHHIQVVLGTPSAAPPAWLTTKYPETLRIEENGQRDEHGNREQFSPNSLKYRQLADRIAHEMAVHYGHNPNVLGWQIDNEIGNPSFDVFAKEQWHRWLQHKYTNIAALNATWTTSYWSQTYDSFDQIPFHSHDENPALLLNYKLFVSDTWASYVKEQVDAIHAAADPHQFITTNTMHWFGEFDHYQMHRQLDLAAWDDYFPDGVLDPIGNAASHDVVRGYKQRNFWVMETQPGSVNWGPVNASYPPGVTREAAWQSIGHGSDAVLYWQWRSALNGQEEYHGTLVGADGNPVPIYTEIQQTGDEFAKASAALANTSPHAQVAILNDYPSRWALGFQKHTQKFDPVAQITDLYHALWSTSAFAGQAIDILSPDADLTPYKLVFAPALNVLPEATAKHLLAYVQRGGHLVLGTRSGMKNADNGLHTTLQPGPLLAEALGGHVAQYYALLKPIPVTGGIATVWAERLTATAPDTKVLMTYGPSATWLANQPAALSRTIGKGTLTYLGATLDAPTLASFAASQLAEVGLQPLLPNLPHDIELMQRTGPSSRVWILINHGDEPHHIALPHTATDLFTSHPVTTLDLAPHAVAVLALPQ